MSDTNARCIEKTLIWLDVELIYNENPESASQNKQL